MSHPKATHRHQRSYLNVKKNKDAANAAIDEWKSLENPPRGEKRRIAAKYGIPETTFNTWINRMSEDPTFDPMVKNYGEHHRRFDEETEDDISNLLWTEWRCNGISFTNELV